MKVGRSLLSVRRISGYTHQRQRIRSASLGTENQNVKFNWQNPFFSTLFPWLSAKMVDNFNLALINDWQLEEIYLKILDPKIS